MAKRQVTLTFPPQLIQEPVIFTMAKEFNVAPNIRRARVTETVGEVTLELDASEDVLNKAVAYLEKRGVKVEPAAGQSGI